MALITKKLFVCRIKYEPLNQSPQNLVAISLLSCLLPDYNLEELHWKLFWPNFLQDVFFLRSYTVLDIPEEWLVQLMWNKKEVTSIFDLTHDLDLWFLKVKFQNIFISRIVIWLMWNKKSITHLADCMILLLTLTLKFHGQGLEQLYLRNGRVDWHGVKGIWVDYSWPWSWPMDNHGEWGGWMCRIVTGVTSDVSVPLTYLVYVWC